MPWIGGLSSTKEWRCPKLSKLSFGDINNRVKARYNVLCEHIVSRRRLENPSPSMKMGLFVVFAQKHSCGERRAGDGT